MTISNTDDVIDSRDVIARIEELEGEREALREEFDENPENEGVDFDSWVRGQVTWGDDEQAELDALKALAEQAEGYASDWQYGETLIRESYWEDYVQELLEDVGDIPRNLPHYIEIDWEATARNIAVDYAEVDFDGVSYWVR